MTDRWLEDRHSVGPKPNHLLSAAPAWLMATAFEVEAGRLSLDQARSRMQRRGLRIVDAVHGPARSSEEECGTTTAAAEPIPSAHWLDPLAVWLSLPPEVRERIGAAAIATAVANLGSNVAEEIADPIAYRYYHTAESEALSLIFELVNINVLSGDDTTLPPRPDLRPLGVRQCRACGCTDDFACDGGCGWVEIDLCSACVPLAHASPE
jgi:hypothetical protein